MNRHHGQLIEKIIRLNGYNISELARLLSVDRRTIYIWFKKKRLKKEVILQFAEHINHDFSVDFPELFQSNDQSNPSWIADRMEQVDEANNDNPDKDIHQKYIELLEKYNQLLQKILFD
ncbi:helix-turn-helix domain-containing protein [Mucilaginibacter sp. CSA2-8R]|uniref:helix-turn-helix domain-containing protein n=1 Tax=Mucilaginibacter sp. CSA2-8R TaxID=3141542 RepID=UPI00315C9A33